MSAPYVGHGSPTLVAGGLVGRVTAEVVAGIDDAGAEVVGGRGRLPPHETRAPTAAMTPTAARLLGIAALSAEMAPEIGEEA